MLLQELRSQFKSYSDLPELQESKKSLLQRIQMLERRKQEFQAAEAFRLADEEKRQSELEREIATQMIEERRAKIDALCQQKMTAEYRKSLVEDCRQRVTKLQAKMSSQEIITNSGAHVAAVAERLAGFYDSMVRRLAAFTRQDFENWRRFDTAFYNDAIKHLGFRTAEEKSLICEAARQFRENQNPPLPTDDIPNVPKPTQPRKGFFSSLTYSQALQQQWELFRAGKKSDHFDRAVYVPEFDAEGNSLWDASGKQPLEGLEPEKTWITGNGDPARPRLFKRKARWFFQPDFKELPWNGELGQSIPNVVRTVDEAARLVGLPKEAREMMIRRLERNPGSMWQKNVCSLAWEFVRETPLELRADILETPQLVSFSSCPPKPDGKYKFLDGMWLYDDSEEVPQQAEQAEVSQQKST